MFIVLEGSDGSGKTTQFKLLTERLRAAGYDVEVYDFPRYDEPSSYFVKRYLNGEYGPAAEVSPYTASLFYALDRFEAAPLIRQSLSEGKIVLANRYAGSNMAHQGAKFTTSGQQRGYFMWADSLEFQLLGIPRPALNIFLRVPAEVAYELIKKKAARSYTNRVHDEHESDIEHLKRSVATYDTLCQLFPKDYKPIECTKNNKILSVTEINNRIWDLLKPLLPKPTHAGHSAVIKLQDSPQLSTAKSQTDIERNEKTIEVKDTSLLMVTRLLGQNSTVNYSLKWPLVTGRARIGYYIPSEFSAKLSNKYQATMGELAKLNRQLAKVMPGSPYHGMTTPLAALVDAKINVQRQSIEELLSQAASEEFSEARQIAKQARVPLQTPKPLKEIIAQLSAAGLASNSSGNDDKVKLIGVQPRNELDLLAECLYPQSHLSPDSLATELDRWTYDKKSAALKQILAADAAVVLEKTRYRFEVIDEISSIQSVIEWLTPSQVQLQPPTPRYGYRVPSEIEQAGADELFIKCFDLSLELYSEIQSAGHDELASYAVLAGHKQRWQFSIGGNNLLGYLDNPPSNVSTLIELLRSKVAEAHPLVEQAAAQPGPIHRPVAKKHTRKRSRKHPA